MKFSVPSALRSPVALVSVAAVFGGVGLALASPSIHSAVNSVFFGLTQPQPEPSQEPLLDTVPIDSNPTIMPVEPLYTEPEYVPNDKKRPATSVTLDGKAVNPDNKPSGSAKSGDTEVTWNSENTDGSQSFSSSVTTRSSTSERSEGDGSSSSSSSSTSVRNSLRVDSSTNIRSSGGKDGSVDVNFEVNNTIP